MATKHYCNKEKELAEMQVNIKEISTDMKWVKEDVAEIRKCITGNGQKGLSQRVRTLENWKWYVAGGIAVIIIFVVPISIKVFGG